LSFLGQIVSANGTQPDPKHIQDLQDAAVPTDVHEVRSFLGIANYNCKYIPDYAMVTAPLSDLTKKDAHFKWEAVHQHAFEKLKHSLTSVPVMAYFDTQKDTVITVDASPVGISAILAQEKPHSDSCRIVAYASRALSPVEKRYSQTEKEALSIVWAVEHFHICSFMANCLNLSMITSPWKSYMVTLSQSHLPALSDGYYVYSHTNLLCSTNQV